MDIVEDFSSQTLRRQWQCGAATFYCTVDGIRAITRGWRLPSDRLPSRIQPANQPNSPVDVLEVSHDVFTSDASGDHLQPVGSPLVIRIALKDRPVGSINELLVGAISD